MKKLVLQCAEEPDDRLTYHPESEVILLNDGAIGQSVDFALNETTGRALAEALYDKYLNANHNPEEVFVAAK